ncbi:MAG: hypothetical protein ACLP1Y_02975 [Candidatus Acidiferrales bacterium]
MRAQSTEQHGARRFRLILQLVGLTAAAIAVCPLFGQQRPGGAPEDWSHHHVVFSNPGTYVGSIRTGSFDKWYKVVSDPRFNFQQVRRGGAPGGGHGPIYIYRTNGTTLQRDWSQALGGAGVAPDTFPAKWQFDVSGNASCSDYVVFGVNAAGSASQANIVGVNNLYNGTCTGTVPNVLFSYFVGSGTVQTSPALGYSVNQVVYIESIAGGSKLHVLTIGTTGSNGTSATSPVTPGTGNNASDVSVTLSGGVMVTRSSVFYDYAHDTAYVGDDTGKLHKFTPVFNGTLAEVVTSSGGDVWPATVSSQASPILTSPVYDGVSQEVWVGDSAGYLYSVSSTTGSGSSGVTQSGQLGKGTGIEEGPIVDSTAQSVYVFVGENVAGANAAVFVFNISAFTSGSTGANVTVGTGSASVPLYSGIPDNTYFTSSNPAQPAGNLYVCGNPGGNPTLYQVPITYASGPHLGTVVTGPVLASSNVGCSPLNEFYNSNTSTDWVFASVGSSSCGASATTQGGCVMSFNITSAAPTIGPWTPSTLFASNAEIVDTSGNIQKCTGGGCGGAYSLSGTTAPAWTTGTTTDGTTINASAVGTVSANSAAGGATVTIGTLTLTASAPTAAHSPILINTAPANNNTITINGTVYDWQGTTARCAASPEKCVQHVASTTTDATNLRNAIAGTCYNGACAVDPTVTATSAGATVTVTAITPGTGANADVLATNHDTSIHINGGVYATTTLGAGTGTLGTNGSNVAPNFQYWSGASNVSTAQLAANIAAAITVAEQTSAGITLSYTAGNTYLTITGAGANAGAAGNSVAVDGSLTGFAWTFNSIATTHLSGGSSPLTWTYQSASNGQTTAPQATGTGGITIDNMGTAAGEANIYFGTLNGTGATNAGVKMSQKGLN